MDTRSAAQAAYDNIFREVIPEAIEHFRSKTRDYRGGGGFLKLGSRGQYSDMSRKDLKLFQAIWEGEPLEGEQPEEIVMDLIGHGFLLLWCLRNEKPRNLLDNGAMKVEQRRASGLDELSVLGPSRVLGDAPPMTVTYPGVTIEHYNDQTGFRYRKEGRGVDWQLVLWDDLDAMTIGAVIDVALDLGVDWIDTLERSKIINWIKERVMVTL